MTAALAVHQDVVSSLPRRGGRAIRVGVCLGGHGVRGLVRIKPFTACASNLDAYGRLLDSTGVRTFKVTVTQVRRGVALCRVDGVCDRAAADRLKGVALHVLRDALPNLGDDSEFYHVDLIGLTAVLPNGDNVGRVCAVHNFGADDLLEIDSGSSALTLVPFTKVHVPKVDLAAGTVTIIMDLTHR